MKSELSIETRYERFTAAVVRHRFKTVREARAWAKVASHATKRLVYWSYANARGSEKTASIILLNACRKKWKRGPKYRQMKIEFNDELD